MIGLATGQEIGSRLTLGLLVFQHGLHPHRAGMGHGHNRALLALACSEAAKPGSEGGLLSVRRRPGCLPQTAPELGTALPRVP